MEVNLCVPSIALISACVLIHSLFSSDYVVAAFDFSLQRSSSVPHKFQSQ